MHSPCSVTGLGMPSMSGGPRVSQPDRTGTSDPGGQLRAGGERRDLARGCWSTHGLAHSGSARGRGARRAHPSGPCSDGHTLAQPGLGPLGGPSTRLWRAGPRARAARGRVADVPTQTPARRTAAADAAADGAARRGLPRRRLGRAPAPRRAAPPGPPRRRPAGPTPPASTAPGGAPGCCSTRPASRSRGSLGCRPDEVSFTGVGDAGRPPRGRRPGRGPRPDRAPSVVVGAWSTPRVLHAVTAVAAGRPAERGRAWSRSTGPAGSTRRRLRPARSAPDTALACLQTANHEVGTEQPRGRGRAPACAAAGVPLLVDAAAVASAADRVPSGWSVLAGERAQVGRSRGRRRARRADRRPLALARARRRPQPRRARARLRGRRWCGGRSGGARGRRRRGRAARGRAAAPRWSTGSASRVPDLVPDCVVLGDPVRRLPHVVTFSFLYVARRGPPRRARPRPASPSRPGRRAAPRASSRATSWSRWARSPRATCGCRSPRGVAEADVDRFLGGAARAPSSGCGTHSGRRGCDRPAAISWSTPAGMALPDAGARAGPPSRPPTCRAAASWPLLSDDPAAATDVPAWCAHARARLPGWAPRPRTAAARPTWSGSR